VNTNLGEIVSDEAVPPLSADEIKAFEEHLYRLRAAGRVAVRAFLEASELQLGGDLLLDAPCSFSGPKRSIAEASYRGERRRSVK
jgi:hypothetical protein